MEIFSYFPFLFKFCDCSDQFFFFPLPGLDQQLWIRSCPSTGRSASRWLCCRVRDLRRVRTLTVLAHEGNVADLRCTSRLALAPSMRTRACSCDDDLKARVAPRRRGMCRCLCIQFSSQGAGNRVCRGNGGRFFGAFCEGGQRCVEE